MDRTASQPVLAKRPIPQELPPSLPSVNLYARFVSRGELPARVHLKGAKMRRRRVVHLFTSVVAATASIAVLAACTSKPAPKEEATTRVSAAEGGLVQNPDGVMLRIPPKALTRDAEATISEIDDGVYDIHLSEALQGAVQVSLPVPDGEATDSYSFMAHEVNGEWTLENATLAGSALVANVNSLSPFKVLKCFKAKRGEPLIDCLLKAGIRQVSKAALTNLLGSVAQSVFDLCYNPGSAVDLILNDCKVGDPEGWQNHTTPPAPANTPTSVHQSPAQGATEEPPTPGTPPRHP